MSAKFSVIIPIYNESLNIDLLYQRLINVISHLISDYELIFVNDGSEDNSLELIKQLSHKDNKVKYIDWKDIDTLKRYIKLK